MRLQNLLDTKIGTRMRGMISSLSSKDGHMKMDLKNQNKVSQLNLSMQYKQLLAQHIPLPRFEDVEFTAFSQTGEDGILLYIFSLIGTTNKMCVEVCCGNGIECNTANLIINHGWRGLLFDGGVEIITKGQNFYRTHLGPSLPPQLVQAWITAENINTLIQENGFEGEIDLLSLDIDGIDYWIWKAIECINPRVIVLEYNCLLGPNRAVTVPYKPDFRAEAIGTEVNYFGASLSAFVKLGKQKGYRLVGCHRYGFNAFFVRSDIGEEVLPEIAPTECFRCFEHPAAKHELEIRRPKIVDKEWIEV